MKKNVTPNTLSVYICQGLSKKSMRQYLNKNLRMKTFLKSYSHITLAMTDFEKMVELLNPHNYLESMNIYGVAIMNIIKTLMIGWNVC